MYTMYPSNITHTCVPYSRITRGKYYVHIYGVRRKYYVYSYGVTHNYCVYIRGVNTVCVKSGCVTLNTENKINC